MFSQASGGCPTSDITAGAIAPPVLYIQSIVETLFGAHNMLLTLASILYYTSIGWPNNVA